MSMEMVLHVALWLVASFGGLWIAQLKYALHKQGQLIEGIQRDYLRRDDASDRMDTLKELVIDVRDRMVRLDEKLDRKADK
ncbi:hypothetical protein FOT62_22720 [Serratia marcescens]|uniref:Uncharacterized protein n=1 Tax=Serratia marcescens TaxID=615 RepID=A0A5C7BX18_SERMA|nr:MULTISPECIES: hypothetical protein [Serratia]TXE27136.1 hypothetical protein FOT62_22720 [Serratia marcescens]TXE55307.1 hypothetical protein FOT56_25445 [Serratia marcescens]